MLLAKPPKRSLKHYMNFDDMSVHDSFIFDGSGRGVIRMITSRNGNPK